MTTDKQDQFAAWWQSDGQYSRAGGGDYEKTFAFNAWQASREQTLNEAEDRVVTLYEAQEPPYLVDICSEIRSLK